jgi:hypothetical protein
MEIELLWRVRGVRRMIMLGLDDLLLLWL